MWHHHLRMALRSLAAHRLFTAINIAGLAIGMAACLLMALWVGSETAYDRWVPERHNVFMVQSKTQYPGRAEERWRHVSLAALPRLEQDHAARIAAATRVLPTSRAMRVGGQIANQALVLADRGFFDVLPWPVAEGSTRDALAAPGRLVVTDRFVRKWFAQGSALGQTVLVTVKGQPRPFEIVAVLAPLPAASVFEFEAVALLDANDLSNPAVAQNWGAFTALALLRLKSPADAAAIDADADAFVQRHIEPFTKVENGFWWRPSLLPLSEVHLKKVNVGGPGKPPGDATLVAAVAAVGLLVLAIATVTYINLATARVTLRAREVGLRKVVGASPAQLVVQFLVESTLLAAAAALLALAMAELALPAFNALLEQNLALDYLGPRGALPTLAAMVAVVGVLGGWYPALVLARLKPRAAAAQLHAGGGAVRVRQALVVVQFAIAVALMSCMAVIFQQVQHLRSVDMGYQPEGLIVISNLQRAEVKARQQALVEAMQRVDGVRAVSRSAVDPTSGGLMRQSAFLPGVPDAQAPQIAVQVVDWDYLATYGARLVAGRNLSRDIAADDADIDDEAVLRQRGLNVLVNRTALRLFELKDPQAVLGRSFQMGPPGQPAERFTVTVVGVVDDLRLRSARDIIEPTFFARQTDIATALSVRVAGMSTGQALPRLEAAWKSLFPETPFAATPVVDAVAGYYRAEARTGQLFALFSGLAIVLCALGLYGLAVFTAERRTREIALRKVLGATTRQILWLLMRQFGRPVLLALLLAWPLAGVLMTQWLQGFDARIALSPLPFVLAGALALLIAWATVAGHALKVARASPALALRAE